MHLGPRDLKEDGDSAKQKGGLGICKACSRWQVRLGGGGSSALTVGDCAQGWRRDRCYIESSAPCLSIYLFIYEEGSHASVPSRPTELSAAMGPKILL